MTTKTILLVDDEPDTLQLIINILEVEFENFEFLEASNTETALQLCAKKKIDLIITDWQMPEKTGIDLIKELRLQTKNMDIPVIISTGVKTEPQDLKQAFEVGAVDFLRKPFERLELVARVKSVLQIKEYQELIIRNKNKELALHAMYLFQNKEKQIQLFKNLQQIIDKINIGKQEAIAFLRTITEEMYSDLKTDVWNDFEFYFGQIYPDFTQRLTARFGDLTPAEIRLCVFIRMNMSSKSIANILHNTEESIKTARKRLRKKLNIDKEQNLTNFITSI